MLEGAWRIVSEVSAGEPNPDAADNGYWFHPDRVVVGSQDCAWEWAARIGPGVLDMWSDDPAYPFQGRGIWERRGNRLWLCWGVRDSGERPAAFTSTAANGWQLSCWSRRTSRSWPNPTLHLTGPARRRFVVYCLPSRPDR